MLILGIESSCDETAASVVRDGVEVLSNVIASQDELHVEYGGVVPEIASRAHVERIQPVIEKALEGADVSLEDIDALACGSQPGLIGSLLVGVAAAKTLAWALDKPIIGVDHVHAHLYAGLLERERPQFPALGLVVSGGHTSLYLCRSMLEIERLGATIDDAVGEAYDKAASMLGIEFPGGPKIDRMAASGDDRAHDFPVSRLAPDSLDFSFSGLKTSVLYTIRGAPKRANGRVEFERDETELSETEKNDIAASFQRAACRAVLLKLQRAFDHLAERGVICRSLLVGGGVSANSRLRTELQGFADERDLDLRLPGMRYCLDNAAMIAGLACEKLRAGVADDLSLRAVPTTRF